MNKIFRLHNTGSETITDWKEITPYDSLVINEIEDPAGGSRKNQITSIPTPFARIDLVKTAFQHLVNEKSLEGDSIYHQLVSDTLDLAELLFNYDLFKDKLQITSWDKKNLNKLLNSPSPQHKLLGNTIKLFYEQDQDAFNFKDFNKFYLIKYNHKVIGGTSPNTLFFTSANDLNFVDVNISGDTFFDKDTNPLFKRNKYFQLYLYGLQRVMPRFSYLFKDFSDYLDLSKDKLAKYNPHLYEELFTIDQTFFDDAFDYLDIGIDGNRMTLFDFSLRKNKERAFTSAFKIAATKPVDIPPLVLQNNFTTPLSYIGDYLWESNIKVPYQDTKPLKERTLPGQQQIKYPYLTVSDFLEPYLIKTIYPINKKYFNGNYPEKNHGFILPIKKEYFKYFSVKDLQGNIKGKKTFELVDISGGAVKAILRIPVQKNEFITFERIYFTADSNSSLPEANEPENTGGIIENQFSLLIYPFIKITDPGISPHYRVMLIDRDVSDATSHFEYNCNFYDDESFLKINPVSIRNRRRKNLDLDGATTKYFILEENFDILEIKHNLAKGIVIPNFPVYQPGADKYSFAIDFGTTNTHIEYRINENKPNPFEIKKEEIQYETLHNPIHIEKSTMPGAILIRDLIQIDFLPDIIQKKSKYYFPQRTALSEHNNISSTERAYTLADYSIPFKYGSHPLLNTKVTPNLKWTNYATNAIDQNRIKAYFEKLVFLMRNKILLSGGELRGVKVMWFYPSSMMPFRVTALESLWEGMLNRYFVNPSISKISESIAPYYYYRKHENIAAVHKPVVSMDIGGGTVDIVAFENDKPQFLSSFKYGANAVFGDGYNSSFKLNGFISKYDEKIAQILSDNELKRLQQVHSEVKHKENSIEVINFYFSLENNYDLLIKNINVSFSEMLKDDAEAKAIILIYFNSIFYHTASLMKTLGTEPPSNFIFSGTASKLLSVLDIYSNTKGFIKIGNLASRIFEIVFSQKISIQITQIDSPKEATSKGGLLAPAHFNNDLDKTVLIDNKTKTLNPEAAVTLKNISEENIAATLREIKEFASALMKIHNEINLHANYGINSSILSRFQNITEDEVLHYLNLGIKELQDELPSGEDYSLGEPLFFLPLKGLLNKLLYETNNEE